MPPGWSCSIRAACFRPGVSKAQLCAMSWCALRGGAEVGGRLGPHSPRFKTQSRPHAHPGRLKRQRRQRHRRGLGSLDRCEACLNPAPLRCLNRGVVPRSAMRRSSRRPVLGAARTSPRRHRFGASRRVFCGHSYLSPSTRYSGTSISRPSCPKPRRPPQADTEACVSSRNGVCPARRCRCASTIS